MERKERRREREREIEENMRDFLIRAEDWWRR